MVERFGGRFQESWSEGDDGLAEDGSLQPKADLFEDSQGLMIEVELPGVGPQDVAITISGGDIVVEAERGFTRNGRAVKQLESSYGRMRRQFQLPIRAMPSKATAELRLGMLKIYVPLRATTATETLTLQPAGDDAARAIGVDAD